MDDGTTLRGWVFRPDVPDDVQVPVILYAGIYWANYAPSPDHWDGPEMHWFDDPNVHVLPEDLVAAGYAVAAFNMRGTGLSDGCMMLHDPAWIPDTLAIIDALSTEAWSNGRVALSGLSYDGAVGLMAATTGHPAIITVVPEAAGPMSLYELMHTPQGAKDRLVLPAWFTDAPVNNGGTATILEGIARHGVRQCPESVSWRLAGGNSWISDERDAGFYERHAFTAGLANITAALLLPHGWGDRGPTGGDWGVGMAQDVTWQEASRAPKRMMHGPWGHQDPAHGNAYLPMLPYQVEHDMLAWHATLIEWYDFWLKGLGEPPALGDVEYTPDGVDVRHSDAWPPSEAREEVLYLGPGLQTQPPRGSRDYVSAPLPGVADYSFDQANPWLPDDLWPGPALIACGDDDRRGVRFVSAPMAEDALLAGLPVAHLLLESSADEGVVTLYLFDLPPDAEGCHPRLLTAGAANLRLHHGGLEPRPFPVDQPTPVRMDLDSVVHSVAAGHRLVAVVSAGDPGDFVYHHGSGAISVVANGTEASSRIILPFVDGSLGGHLPTLTVPPRPFTAPWFEAQGATADREGGDATAAGSLHGGSALAPGVL